MKEWHILYRAEVESYPSNIVWAAEFCGTLAEAINWLYKEEKVIEIVDMYEVEK